MKSFSEMLDGSPLTFSEIAVRAKISRISLWRLKSGEVENPKDVTVRNLSRALRRSQAAVRRSIRRSWRLAQRHPTAGERIRQELKARGSRRGSRARAGR